MVLVLYVVAIVVSLEGIVVLVVDSDVALVVMVVGVVGSPVDEVAFSLGIELTGNAVVAVVVLSTDVAGEVSKTVVLLVVVVVTVEPFGLAVSV